MSVPHFIGQLAYLIGTGFTGAKSGLATGRSHARAGGIAYRGNRIAIGMIDNAVNRVGCHLVSPANRSGREECPS
jgi:hypothetical protein